MANTLMYSSSTKLAYILGNLTIPVGGNTMYRFLKVVKQWLL